MVYAYVGAALAVGLLIGVIALAIVWMSRKVTKDIRQRTVSLISSYDALLEKKSEELHRSEQESEAETETESVRKKEYVSYDKPAVQRISSVQDEKIVLNYAEIMNSSTYMGADYGAVYKIIRNGFTSNPEQAIAEHVSYTGQQGPATKILNELDYETIYKMSILDRDEQVSLLEESLEGEQKVLFDEFCASHRQFSIIEFYEYLQSVAVTEPRRAVLYVSPRDAGRAYPGSVDVVVDETICEGFQIETDNKIYDYSIKEREIV